MKKNIFKSIFTLCVLFLFAIFLISCKRRVPKPEPPIDKTTFTLTFETNGGSMIAPINVKLGETISKPANPTKPGYTFDEWYTTNDLFEKVTWPITMTSNKTVYAKWIEEVNVYDKLDVKVEGDIVSWKRVNSEKYKISINGNYLGETSSLQYNIPNEYQDGKNYLVTVTAANHSEYVFYQAESQKLRIEAPSQARMERYVFRWKWASFDNQTNGFNVYINGKHMSTQYAPAYDITSLVKDLYTSATFKFAVYALGNDEILDSEILSYEYTYNVEVFNVTFMYNDGTDRNEKVSTYDGKVTPPKPTREGYTFNGWYTSSDGGNQLIRQFVESNKVMEDITVYADWVDKATAEDGKIILNAPSVSIDGYSAYWKVDPHASRYEIIVDGYCENGSKCFTDTIIESGSSYNFSYYRYNANNINIRIRALGDGGYTTINSSYTQRSISFTKANISMSFSFDYDIGVIYWTDTYSSYYDISLKQNNVIVDEVTSYRPEYLVPNHVDAGDYVIVVNDINYNVKIRSIRPPQNSIIKMENSFISLSWSNSKYADIYHIYINGEKVTSVTTNSVKLSNMELLISGENTISIQAANLAGDYFVSHPSHIKFNAYKLSFVTNQEDIEIESYYSLKNITSLPEPQKNGYKFLGWYYDSALTEVVVDNGLIDGDQILYGKWEERINAESFNYTLLANDTYRIESIKNGVNLSENILLPDKFNNKFITEIGNGVFKNTTIKTIEIPASILKIDSEAFMDASKLEVVCFENQSDLATIGDNAFSNTRSLKEINLPQKLTQINARAFYLSGLKTVFIPKSVTTIRDYAFYSNNGLIIAVEHQVIPPSWARNWQNGSTVYWDTQGIIVEEYIHYLIKDQVATVVSYNSENNLKMIIIPEYIKGYKVTKILNLYGVDYTPVYIPDTIEEVDSSAFYNGRFDIYTNHLNPTWTISNSEIVLYKGVVELSYDGLYRYVKFIDRVHILGFNTSPSSDDIIKIPNKIDDLPVNGIARYAFRDEIEKINFFIPDSVSYIGRYAFNSAKIYAEHLEMPKGWDSYFNNNNSLDFGIIIDDEFIYRQIGNSRVSIISKISEHTHILYIPKEVQGYQVYEITSNALGNKKIEFIYIPREVYSVYFNRDRVSIIYTDAEEIPRSWSIENVSQLVVVGQNMIDVQMNSEFLYHIKNKEVHIIKYIGEERPYIVVPANIEGYEVTTINALAFNSFETVFIPKNIKSFNAWGLVNVILLFEDMFDEFVLPDFSSTVNNVSKIIEDDVFVYAQVENNLEIIKLKNNYPDELVIPEQVQDKDVVAIHPKVFKDVKAKYILIPKTIIKVEDWAFEVERFYTTILIMNESIPSTWNRNWHKNNYNFLLCEVVGVKSIDRDNDFIYAINDDGATIVGLTDATNRKVVIPATFKGHKVFQIGHNVFEDYAHDELFIPKNITDIWASSFRKANISSVLFESDSIHYLHGDFNAVDFSYVLGVKGTLQDEVLKYAITDKGLYIYDTVKSDNNQIIIIPSHFQGRDIVGISQNAIRLSGYTENAVYVPDTIIEVGRLGLSGQRLFMQAKSKPSTWHREAISNITSESYDAIIHNGAIYTRIYGEEFKIRLSTIYQTDGNYYEITSAFDDYTVTEIGHNLIAPNLNINAIFIPETINYIYEKAFNKFTGTFYTTLSSKPKNWNGVSNIVLDAKIILADQLAYLEKNKEMYVIGTVVNSNQIELSIPRTVENKPIVGIQTGSFRDINLKALHILDNILYVEPNSIKGLSTWPVYVEHTSKPSGWDPAFTNYMNPIVWNMMSEYSDEYFDYVEMNGNMYIRKFHYTTHIETLELPIEVNNKPLVGILSQAFSKTNNFNRIIIGEHIVYVEEYAFYDVANKIFLIKHQDKPKDWKDIWCMYHETNVIFYDTLEYHSDSKYQYARNSNGMYVVWININPASSIYRIPEYVNNQKVVGLINRQNTSEMHIVLPASISYLMTSAKGNIYTMDKKESWQAYNAVIIDKTIDVFEDEHMIYCQRTTGIYIAKYKHKTEELVIIPTRVLNKPIVGITQYAFYQIKKIYIPKTIINIEKYGIFLADSLFAEVDHYLDTWDQNAILGGEITYGHQRPQANDYL